jgi:hypothetical protein
MKEQVVLHKVDAEGQSATPQLRRCGVTCLNVLSSSRPCSSAMCAAMAFLCNSDAGLERQMEASDSFCGHVQ